MTRVLVVDDSEDLQEMLQIVLSDAGFEVIAALDGVRGLAAAAELHPDVILLDMMMPEMDGLEFLSRLPVSSAPPVVASSGFSSLREEALRRGAVAFLVKPISNETVIAALRSAVEKGSVAPAIVEQNSSYAARAAQLNEEASRVAVARLDERGLSDAREGLQRITRWMSEYFGFGTSIVHILRGPDLCVEATYCGEACEFPKPPLHEGVRYPRTLVYCDDVIASGSTVVLTDAISHPSAHFSKHRCIEIGSRFYAGVPLEVFGATVGTLCIIDKVSHEFSSEDMRLLAALGRAAGVGLETSVWPLDANGIFPSEYLELFIRIVATRATCKGGAGVGILLDRPVASPGTRGIAIVRLRDRAIAFGSGPRGSLGLPGNVLEASVEQVDLTDAMARDEAVSRLRSLLLERSPEATSVPGSSYRH